MDLNIPDNGRTIKLMVLENSYLLIKMYMKVNSNKEKSMEKENIHTLPDKFMMDFGKRIWNMVRVPKY